VMSPAVVVRGANELPPAAASAVALLDVVSPLTAAAPVAESSSARRRKEETWRTPEGDKTSCILWNLSVELRDARCLHGAMGV
jgi:hypothetical protein